MRDDQVVSSRFCGLPGSGIGVMQADARVGANPYATSREGQHFFAAIDRIDAGLVIDPQEGVEKPSVPVAEEAAR